MQRVTEANQESILGFPAGVIGGAARQRAQLHLIEPCTLGEECHVHAPFVLRAATGGDAVDYDLSLPQRQVALVEQACAHEAREETLVAGEYAKEHERRDTCGQQRIEPRLDLGGVGGGRGGDGGGLGHSTSFFAIGFTGDIGHHATETYYPVKYAR